MYKGIKINTTGTLETPLMVPAQEQGKVLFYILILRACVKNTTQFR